MRNIMVFVVRKRYRLLVIDFWINDFYSVNLSYLQEDVVGRSFQHHLDSFTLYWLRVYCGSTFSIITG
jgi:hypothetical protein